MIQPRPSIMPMVGNNGLCPAFSSFVSHILLSSPNPLSSFNPKPFPPHLPLLHPTPCFLSLTPLSPVTSSTRPRAKNLDTWPGGKAYSERKILVTPERCGSQSGCQRCSSMPWPHLQQQMKEYSLTNINHFLIYFLGVGGAQTKYLISKNFFSWAGEGRPR